MIVRTEESLQNSDHGLRVAIGAEDTRDVLEERDHPTAARAARHCALDRRHHLNDVEGFREIVEDAVTQTFDCGLDRLRFVVRAIKVSWRQR